MCIALVYTAGLFLKNYVNMCVIFGRLTKKKSFYCKLKNKHV